MYKIQNPKMYCIFKVFKRFCAFCYTRLYKKVHKCYDKVVRRDATHTHTHTHIGGNEL